MGIRPLISALWRSRTGPLLVAIQIAITLSVLVNIVYIVEQRLESVGRPTGIDIDNIFWVRSEGYAADYNQAATVQADLAFLNAIPGVIAASISHNLPQTFSSSSLPFATKPEADKNEIGLLYLTSEKSVETLGLKLIAGRALSRDVVQPPASDIYAAIGKWAPEIVVTQALATKLFPNGDALGKTVYVGLINQSSQIVGIVERMQAMPISGPNASMMDQIALVPAIPPGPGALYLIRTKPGRRDEIMAKVEKELEPLQPGRFVSHIESLAETAGRTRTPARATATFLAIVAVFVLAVAALGIFGLAAFNVTTRTKQIGTRRAVGARKSDILGYFFVENWLITTTGAVVGCFIALAVGVKLSLMFQTPRLPLYYLVGGVLAMWALGLCATLIPARRAAAVSPAVATRSV